MRTQTTLGLTLSLLCFAAAAVPACASAESDDTTESANALSGDGGVGGGNASALKLTRDRDWSGPPPGTDDNPLDGGKVLSAWRKVRDAFYTAPGKGYSPKPAAVPSNQEPPACFSACPNTWSDIVCHFYCWHPTYQPVVEPNIRSCFSRVARGAVLAPTNPPRALYFPEVYDYCTYEDFNQMNASPPRTPAYDQALIDANKAAGKMPGQLAWVAKNEASAYKHVMYTWYNPFAFKATDQQDTINAFYDVKLKQKTYTTSDKAAVAECNAKRPLRPTDPTDGTHCSYGQKPERFTKDPGAAPIVAYMTALANAK